MCRFSAFPDFGFRFYVSGFLMNTRTPCGLAAGMNRKIRTNKSITPCALGAGFFTPF